MMIELAIAAVLLAAPTPALETWADVYLDSTEMQLPIPDRTALAMTRMYRQAISRGSGDLMADVLADPYRARWSYCGDSASFYAAVLAQHGYTVERIDLWYYSRSNYDGAHVGVEITGPGLSRPVFYDPLYGVWLEIAGRRVGVSEAVLAADEQDFRTGAVAVQPVRVEGYVPAADPAFETFNAMDYYPRLYPTYWNGVVRYGAGNSEWLFLLRDDRYIDAEHVLEKYGSRRSISIYRRVLP